MTSTNILSLAILFLIYTQQQNTNVNAFTIGINPKQPLTTTTTKLHGIIEALDTGDISEDPGLPTVRQAEQSASVLLGTVQTSNAGGQINPVAQSIQLYTKLTSQDDAQAAAAVGTILCKGMGTEVYTDPGDSAEKLVTLATEDAVRNALADMDASSSSLLLDGKLCITFAGGDDLMVHEVLQGVEMMTSELNPKPEVSVEFRSLCHESFPREKCGVAAVVVEEEGGGGGVFWNQGQWWTVLEEDATDII